MNYFDSYYLDLTKKYQNKENNNTEFQNIDVTNITNKEIFSNKHFNIQKKLIQIIFLLFLLFLLFLILKFF